MVRIGVRLIPTGKSKLMEFHASSQKRNPLNVPLSTNNNLIGSQAEMSVSVEQFVQLVSDSGLLTAQDVKSFQDTVQGQPSRTTEDIAHELIQRKKLTEYQAHTLCEGMLHPFILGQYVIIDKLGSGGMGDVYKAVHRRMQRVVALKTLSPSISENQESLERFQREVRAAAKLNHPHIVTAHDASESDGTHYLVMEYVDGKDLAQLVKEAGLLPVEQALDYVVQAARGLEYAHKQNVVHRDIKPANLLLDTEGTIKILDMGLARLVSSATETLEDDERELTKVGDVVGTMYYISPEQAMNSKEADHRSDIYSLGCTLYFLVSGRHVYGRAQSWTEAVLAHRDKPIPSLRQADSAVTESLDRAFQRMVAKRPEDRFDSTSDLIAVLQSCQTEISSGARGTERQELGRTADSDGDVDIGDVPTATLDVSRAKPQSRAKRLAAMALLAAAVIGALYYLAGVMITLNTPEGTLVVTVNEPGAVVTVLDEKGVVEIQRKINGERLRISIAPGRKRLRVEKGGFQIFTEQFSVVDSGNETIAARLLPLEATAPTDRQLDDSEHRAARSRALAQWVFDRDGVVNVALTDQAPIRRRRDQLRFRTTEDLPDSAFEVWRVSFADCDGFDDVAFQRFAELSGRLSSVTNINLGGTALTSAGLAHLKSFPQLLELGIQNTPAVTDDATIDALLECRRLRTLFLAAPIGTGSGNSATTISPEAIARLKRTLPKCDIVWQDDPSLRAAEWVVRRGGTLQVVVDDATISVNGLDDLPDAAFFVKRVNLEGIEFSTGLVNLRGLANLTSLNLSQTLVDDEATRWLMNLPALEMLDLRSTSVGDKSLENLKLITSLKDIYLAGTNVSDGGIELLKTALPDCEIHP